MAKNQQHLAGKIKPNQVGKSVNKLPKMKEQGDYDVNASVEKDSLMEESKDGSQDPPSKQLDGEPNEYISNEDTGMIFENVQMPSLTLTNVKVKKSRQDIQDAFSMLNRNMVLIDTYMKDMLFLVKDLAQVLYICFDTRINKIQQGQGQMRQRLANQGGRFAIEEQKATAALKAAIETNNRKEGIKTDHKLEEFKSGPFVKFL